MSKKDRWICKIRSFTEEFVPFISESLGAMVDGCVCVTENFIECMPVTFRPYLGFSHRRRKGVIVRERLELILSCAGGDLSSLCVLEQRNGLRDLLLAEKNPN